MTRFEVLSEKSVDLLSKLSPCCFQRKGCHQSSSLMTVENCSELVVDWCLSDASPFLRPAHHPRLPHLNVILSCLPRKHIVTVQNCPEIAEIAANASVFFVSHRFFAFASQVGWSYHSKSLATPGSSSERYPSPTSWRSRSPLWASRWSFSGPAIFGELKLLGKYSLYIVVNSGYIVHYH